MKIVRRPYQAELDLSPREQPKLAQIGYVPTAMIYATMPYNKTTKLEVKRTVCGMNISIINRSDIGLPYGKFPRLIAPYLAKEAKRTGDRLISLGTSRRDFVERLGLKHGCGPRGNTTRVCEQAVRLLTCRITVIGDLFGKMCWRDISLAESAAFWADDGVTRTWPSHVMLTEAFFHACIEHSVPVDTDVLHDLQSARAIDIYTWATWRCNAIRKPTPVGWDMLKEQFGGEDKYAGSFRREFEKQLANVHEKYPDLCANVNDTGLVLFPSRPHITRKE